MNEFLPLNSPLQLDSPLSANQNDITNRVALCPSNNSNCLIISKFIHFCSMFQNSTLENFG